MSEDELVRLERLINEVKNSIDLRNEKFRNEIQNNRSDIDEIKAKMSSIEKQSNQTQNETDVNSTLLEEIKGTVQKTDDKIDKIYSKGMFALIGFVLSILLVLIKVLG